MGITDSSTREALLGIGKLTTRRYVFVGPASKVGTRMDGLNKKLMVLTL